MAETVVRCPGCRVGIKIKAVPPGKKAFACPKCKARVPYPELEEEALDVVAVDDEDEEEEEAAPVVPRRRRARRDDDDDEDDRPRRRKKRKKAAEPVDRPWLWPVTLFGCLVVTLIAIGMFYVVNGPDGFPEAQDGPPIIKPIVLGFIVILGAFVAVSGCAAIVSQRVVLAKYFLTIKVWEEEHRGTMAVVIGVVQSLLGSFMMGTGIYGIVF
jgi:hypothetical protein